MKLISCNCRGASNSPFEVNCRNLIGQHDPSIFCLMETQVEDVKEDSRLCLARLGNRSLFQRWAALAEQLYFGGMRSCICILSRSGRKVKHFLA